jgi:hypothetical protein
MSATAASPLQRPNATDPVAAALRETAKQANSSALLAGVFAQTGFATVTKIALTEPTKKIAEDEHQRLLTEEPQPLAARHPRLLRLRAEGQL